ncbi:unannotated protein [freshwater metagenome]|uniref:Unannotated protein n=1 Tax=freshwater metagenome TaxID=449393 RepID=A0A6J7JM63_9ZZZZ
MRGHRVEAAGRTDPEITRALLLADGATDAEVDGGLAAFSDVVVQRYAQIIPDSLAHELLPGAAAVLEELARDETMRLALVTGNLEGIARLKLGAAGVGQHFEHGQGAFGSDSEDRLHLPPIARLRAGRAWGGGEPWPRERTVVIGDTPRDIACARADGVHVVCVTTGSYGADELAEADVVIGSFDELGAALAPF